MNETATLKSEPKLPVGLQLKVPIPGTDKFVEFTTDREDFTLADTMDHALTLNSERIGIPIAQLAEQLHANSEVQPLTAEEERTYQYAASGESLLPNNAFKRFVAMVLARMHGNAAETEAPSTAPIAPEQVLTKGTKVVIVLPPELGLPNMEMTAEMEQASLTENLEYFLFSPAGRIAKQGLPNAAFAQKIFESGLELTEAEKKQYDFAQTAVTKDSALHRFVVMVLSRFARATL